MRILKKLIILEQLNYYLKVKITHFYQKSLVTINTDVDIDFDLDALSIDKLCYDKFLSALHSYDIHSFDKFLNIKPNLENEDIKK